MPDTCTLNTMIAQKRINKNPYFHCGPFCITKMLWHSKTSLKIITDKI